MQSYAQTPKKTRVGNANGHRAALVKNVTCKAAIHHLGNYLADHLSQGEQVALETHLDTCPDCRAFLSTYKKTIEMTRGLLILQRREAQPITDLCKI